MDQMMDWVKSLNPRLHGKRKFVVNLDEQWLNFILQNCGEGKYFKHLSPIILNNKHLDCLFEGMMIGDGCKSKSAKGYWSQRYFTVSSKLAEGFEERSLTKETYLSIARKYTLISDSEQFIASKNLWKSISREDEIYVYVWDGLTNSFILENNKPKRYNGNNIVENEIWGKEAKHIARLLVASPKEIKG
jgi:hypothetical protein